jgi:O-antigen/teichoic acid export membrane protein
MSQGEQSAVRRLSVITIDQVIAGGSNVLSAVLAARVLGVASFGLFGIVFLVYMVSLGISRALVSDPLLVHHVEAEERPGEAIGTSLVIGLAVGALLVAVGFGISMFNARLGGALVVLGGCFPLLVLQDLGRYLSFATQRPGFAVVLDSAWLLIMFGAVAAVFATGSRTLVWFIAAWAGSGAAAGLLLFSRYRVREVRFSLAWLRHTWSFSWRYLVSYTATQGAALGAASGVGAAAGARALGGVQGAILLVRPFMTFQIAAIAATVGEVTRSLTAHHKLRKPIIRTSVLTTAVALINAAILLAIPDRLGKVALGASWHATKPLLLPTGVQIACIGLYTGVRAGMLGMREIKKVMRVDVASTVAVMTATIIGAVINGAKGALWAVAIGQAATALGWWLIFLAHTRQARRMARGGRIVITPIQMPSAPMPPAAIATSIVPPAVVHHLSSHVPDH